MYWWHYHLHQSRKSSSLDSQRFVCCRYKPERYMQTVFAVSAFTLCVPVANHLHSSRKSSFVDPNVLLVAGTSLSDTCRRCLQCLPSPCVCQWRTICTAVVKAALLTQTPQVCTAFPFVFPFKANTAGDKCPKCPVGQHVPR